jgi:thiol-disulfide isomerase/thioredoxin
MIRLRFVIAMSALGLAIPFAPVSAQDKKDLPPKAKPGPSLKVGDPAPALKVTRWLQGEEVQKFEPGKAYVVHFWAPWCGNCVSFMPRFAELQARYKDQGLTVIGLSVVDPNNSEKNVAAFVKKRGPSLPYRLAFAGDRTMYDNWVTAAGVATMSCAFLVDKTGRIADIGHVFYWDVALPKVIAGAAAAQEIGDEMEKIHAEVVAFLEAAQRDPKAGRQSIKAFEAKYPPLGDFFLAATTKVGLLSKHGNPGEAKAYAEALVAKATKKSDVRMLRQASLILRVEGKESKELLALAVAAAKEVVRIEGGADAQSLIDLADAYFASGDKAKAKEWAGKAVEAARGESPTVRESIAKEARRLGTE